MFASEPKPPAAVTPLVTIMLQPRPDKKTKAKLDKCTKLVKACLPQALHKVGEATIQPGPSIGQTI